MPGVAGVPGVPGVPGVVTVEPVSRLTPGRPTGTYSIEMFWPKLTEPAYSWPRHSVEEFWMQFGVNSIAAMFALTFTPLLMSISPRTVAQTIGASGLVPGTMNHILCAALVAESIVRFSSPNAFAKNATSARVLSCNAAELENRSSEHAMAFTTTGVVDAITWLIQTWLAGLLSILHWSEGITTSVKPMFVQSVFV